ncbi:MAG: amidase [Burkholderiales bacterium]
MLTSSEYSKYDALGLAGLVKRKEVSPTELLKSALALVARVNPKINALCNLSVEVARAAIAKGLPPGPFEGVPFLLKDLGAAAIGTPCSSGSRFFAGATAEHDAEIVARYRKAGLVIFGRTTSPEMGINPSTEAVVYGGPTRNPWNLNHSAGGSSGGAGAAVAAGILPMAHASDGAGSIRIPAACDGLFGLKPSRGRMPLGPDMGEGWGGLLSQHVVSRTVRDSAAALDATHGEDVGAPYAAPPAPGIAYLDAIKTPPERLRIAFTDTTFEGGAIDPEVAHAVRSVAQACAGLGHSLEEARPQIGLQEMLRPLMVVVATGTGAAIRARSRVLGRVPREDELEPVTRGALEVSQTLTAADYLEAISTLHSLSRRVAHFFARYDVLLLPVLAEPPAVIGRFAMTQPDFMAYRLGTKGIAPYSPFTPLANMTGQPAASLPLAWSQSGLPIGIQIITRFGDEVTLLKLAAQLEAVQPWFDRRPGLGADQAADS